MIAREKEKRIVSLYEDGESKASIAKKVDVSRPTVYRVLRQKEERKARQRKREVEKTLKEVVREELNRAVRKVKRRAGKSPYPEDLFAVIFLK